MRRLSVTLIAAVSTIAFIQSTSAADLPVKAPVSKAPVLVPYNWTGFYLGGHGGCGWSSTPSPSNYAVDGAETLGVFGTESASGCFRGGQVGYNYQFSNNVVIGIEADLSFGNISSFNNWTQTPELDEVNTWQSKLKTFGTVRGRLGYANGQWLPYVTGGWAFGRNEIRYQGDDGTLTQDTQTHTGWAAGAGVEYMLTRNWSAKLEYMYLGLNSKRYALQIDDDPGVPLGADFGNLGVHTIKIGTNYHFGSDGLTGFLPTFDSRPTASWAGFYVGSHFGCATYDTPTPATFVDATPGTGGFGARTEDSTGCYGGGQIGYNFQLANNIVLGIEGDASFANISSFNTFGTISNGEFETVGWESRLQSFGTLRGRVGYAYGQWLPYATGGWAWGRNRLSVPGNAVHVTPLPPVGASEDTQTHSGWTLGGGVEFAINSNWSWKAEYLYLGLNGKTYAVGLGDDGPTSSTTLDSFGVHTFKTGLNYRFNPGATIGAK
jgi:outer membrane immunogenic protein